MYFSMIYTSYYIPFYIYTHIFIYITETKCRHSDVPPSDRSHVYMNEYNLHHSRIDLFVQMILV